MDRELLEALILGAVQGVAEFLPISSSGHLVIAQELLGAAPSGRMTMNVAVHAGTLLSILVVYWRDLRGILWKPHLCLAIVLATIPAAIAGLTLEDYFERAFSSPLVAGSALLLTASFLIVGQRLERNRDDLEQIRPGQALVVGCLQAVAIIPGISRSGSTIAGGLLVGLRRDAAAAFSFLIAIPVIGGAALLKAKDLLDPESTEVIHLLPLAVGAVTAFLVGLVALRGLIRIVAAGKLHWFAIYCIVVGLATIAWQLSLR